ncbi:hypothetical protein BX600DRAFT_484435 [Xylariales sp. PMI_506]|nr:hypothetical protein BX600DRAFT_484435 [Xylariales sp. PMI_506]
MKLLSKLKVKISERRGRSPGGRSDEGSIASFTPTTADPALVSAAVASETPDVTNNAQTSNIVPHVDLWTQAFKIFKEKEPELAADYKKHLESLQNNNTADVDLSAPRSVESLVKQLCDEREKKQWKITLGHKDIKIRKQVENLAKFLLWSDSVVKNVLSAQPYAALAWSGVSLLLPLLTSGTTYNEAMLQGFNSISNIQLYWDICEKTYLQSAERSHYEELTEPLAKLYSHIVEYQARVICHLSKAQLSRAWQGTFGENDWNKNTAAITSSSEQCSKLIPALREGEVREQWASHLAEMRQSRNILEGIHQILEDGGRQIQRNYDDEKERALFHDLACDYEGYKNFNPPRVKGTCEWFFNDERFHKWRDSNTSSLLWVSAGPGCGKSVLSRALIDDHRLSTSLTTATICYFFFKDGDEGRRYSMNALCAILHQLFKQDLSGDLIKYALSSHKFQGTKLTGNFSELWRLLVASAKSSDAEEIICVLDALDECDKNSREQLIDSLKDLYCQPRELQNLKLKFLITSRPYDDLEEYFNRFTTTNYLRFDGDEKSADIGREINLVIDEYVDRFTVGFPDEHRRQLSDHLKIMDNRTYLWLYLIFDTVKANLSVYKKWSNFGALLSDIPHGVFEAYEKILSKGHETQTETLLRIILAATRPLTLDEVNIALTSALKTQRFSSHMALESDLWPKVGFKNTVQNLCGLFINVYDSKLSFIHQTARDFLTHSRRQGTWQGRFSMSRSHSMLSQVCIDYLLLPGLTDIEPSHCLFLSYAGRNWPLHYTSQERDAAHRSRKDARTLCNVAGEQEEIWVYDYFRRRYRPERDWTDLALASYLGLIPVVEDILNEEEVDVNVVAEGYGTALMAASNGHKEIVQLLLDHGADVNIAGKYGTALMRAAENGHKEIVQLLLDHSANVNTVGEYTTALISAAENGHKEITQLLLDHGADVNVTGVDGTALTVASRGKYETALMRAAENGHKEIVQLLLDHGADVNTTGDYGTATALMVASSGGYEEIVQLLLDHGADVNTTGDYRTALMAASSYGHKEIVKLLLDHGVWGTALMAASSYGHKEIVKLLLDHGADVNIEHGQYGTALTVASNGHKEIVQLLLDHGADVNTVARNI